MKKSAFECVRDGYTIRGFEFSDGNSEGKKPVAIISHGFMANQRSVKRYAKLFAKSGYLAYTFDFVGGCIKGMSDGSLDKDMTLETEIADLKTVINYVKTNCCEYADVNSVTLMGCSQGGAVSAMVAGDIPEQISKLVLFYPALCIHDDAMKGQMIMYKFDPNNIPEKIHGFANIYISGEYARVAQKINIQERMISYKGPVLLLHGNADKCVPLDYSIDAFEKYRKSREDGDDPDKGVFFYIIEKGKHNFTFSKDRKAMAFVSEFIAK